MLLLLRWLSLCRAHTGVANDRRTRLGRRHHDSGSSIPHCALVLENPQLEAHALARPSVGDVMVTSHHSATIENTGE